MGIVLLAARARSSGGHRPSSSAQRRRAVTTPSSAPTWGGTGASGAEYRRFGGDRFPFHQKRVSAKTELPTYVCTLHFTPN